MSKRGYISRYMLIVKKLTAKPYSAYDELQDYVDRQFEYLQIHDDALNIGFSKRTFQRDIREIGSLFGIDIEYSKSNKGYFISAGTMENMNFQRMMEAFDLFNSLSLSKDLAPFVQMENRLPQGTEYFHLLLHAIKHRLELTFDYQKFSEDKPTLRMVQPFGLKEFKNRWYVLGKNIEKDAIRCYGLDRIKNLEITNKKFTTYPNFNIEEYFRYSFGIITPDEDEPEEVILSFSPDQGKYTKTLPLHATQEIISDDKVALVVKLKLHITYDFIMELLSFGETVKVISPESLAGQLMHVHKNALSLYAKL